MAGRGAWRGTGRPPKERRPAAKKRSSSTRRYSAASALSGMTAAAPVRRLRSAARCSGVAAGRPSVIRPNSASDIGRAASSTAWKAAGPPLATSVSGSSPPGRVAKRSVRSVEISGSATSAARAAARAPAASPSKQSTGSGLMRHNSSSCSGVSAVPSGATAPWNPAWCSAITSM